MSFEYKSEYQRYKRYYSDLKKLYYSRKEIKAYADFSFAMLTAAFFIVFAVRPTLVTIGKLKADIRSQEDVDKRLEEKITHLRQAFGNYDRVKGRLTVLDEAGPEVPWVARFVGQLEGAAFQNGVVIRMLSLEGADVKGGDDKKIKPEGGDRVRFNLSTEGEFEGLQSFLGKIEKMKRIVIVDSYAFSKSADGENGAIMTLSLNGGLVYFPQANELKGIESGIEYEKKEESDNAGI